MTDIFDVHKLRNYWDQRYAHNHIGWDIGQISSPIKAYIDQLTRKDLRILVPGAGNAHEAEYLYKQGFEQTFVLDVAPTPLAKFKERVPDFPSSQLIEQNFFDHKGSYDLILEQTFFCSFAPNPANRQAYSRKTHKLLVPGGKLVGVWFQFPLRPDQSSPPYGGSAIEYRGYFSPYFHIEVLETCYNSIPPREGSELFGLMVRQ